MSQLSRLHLSLTDVARLAGVQRPVVSMWRRREVAGYPFPTPVAVIGGEERFDAHEVAAYLKGTSRGRNPEAREDLAAHVRLAAVTGLDEALAVDGLTALLTLVAMTGESLGELGAPALTALAERADPGDTLLVREVRALGRDLPALAAHADALTDAAYSPPRAFEGLLTRQLHRSLPGQAAVALQPPAITLVTRVARALAADAGMESPVFVDITDGGGDLLLAVAQSYAAQASPNLATPATDSRVARLVRRRLRVHDLHRVDVALDDSDQLPTLGGGGHVVHVLQLPPAGRPDLPDVEILRTLDDLVLGMDEHALAVVLGPARALTDAPPSGEADLLRDAILRTDCLRAAVRLPKGLLVRSPREALGLWVLGRAHRDVPPAARWTAVADVSDRTLTDAVIDAVVTDVVAAMGSEGLSRTARRPGADAFEDARQARGHQFHFARRVRTATLLPGRRPLVDKPTSRAAARISDAGATVASLAQSLGQGPLAALRVEAGAYAAGTDPAQRTLGEAVTAGQLRIVPGNRVDPADLAVGGEGRAVIGPDELLGVLPPGGRTIDLLTFAGRYESGRLTEPGDVVFCTSPRIAAYVDHAGGSVVVAPARVLRVTESGQETLLPEVVAADITAHASQAGSAKDWRRWPVRPAPRGQRKPLADTLTEIARQRLQALDRVRRLDLLAASLRDGVLGGALTISAAPQAHLGQTGPQESTDLPSRRPGREGS